MVFQSENRPHTLHGILLVALFSLAAFSIHRLEVIQSLHLSPLILGIIIGIFYAQTLRKDLPKSWDNGIIFSAKKILRLGIILYGFRLTFQEILDIGIFGLSVALIMVISTFGLGFFLGEKIFKLDRELSLLISSGSAVCGAAAVMATESVLKAKPYKSVIAVGTVVVFGTISMIVFPALYPLTQISPEVFGIWIGGSIHEVAQVVAAGNIIEGAADNAIVVKMTRVILLVPLLFLLGYFCTPQSSSKKSFKIPWFALFFLTVIGINSLKIIPPSYQTHILTIDTFLLTMAMTALGMETSFKKFREVGMKPFLMSGVLFLWLIFGGLLTVKYLEKFL